MMALIARVAGAAGLPWLLVLALAAGLGAQRLQVLGMRADAANLVAQAAQERVLQSERARAIEHKLGEENAKISDKLAAAVAARDTAKRSVVASLRKLATPDAPRPTAAAEAQCRDLDAPAVAIISGAVTDNLIELAADADAVAARLVAAQDYIQKVCLAAHVGSQ